MNIHAYSTRAVRACGIDSEGINSVVIAEAVCGGGLKEREGERKKE